ncbi:MAG: hypothetical protein MJ207_00905 [Bacilli bacterium]|nr:hypothetical protein [Bacilli bacterium]
MNKIRQALLYSTIILLLLGLILFVTGASLGKAHSASFPLMAAGVIIFCLGLIDLVCFIFYQMRLHDKKKKEENRMSRD